MGASFADRLDAVLRAHRTVLTVGLDPRPGAFPQPLAEEATSSSLARFLTGIVESTRDHCAVYKMQFASYLSFGQAGLLELLRLPSLIGPDHLTILDLKAADIPATMELYREGVLGRFGFDAMTVNPFLGWDSVGAAMGGEGKGIFVLLHTSNPGARDLQESLTPQGTELWHELLPRVRALGERGGVGAVVGGTFPEALTLARKSLGPKIPLLVPGVGVQGASLPDVMARAMGDGAGALLVNSSRGILYASSGDDWKEAAGREAARLTQEMRTFLR